VLLYLVNAAESPTGAVYVAAEMDLLTWIGKPVLVLLNQLGTPRPPADEAADLQAWRDHLTRWPLVADVLPLDAFARCWVHERTLLQAVQAALHGPQAQRMAELEAAWLAQREATFKESMRVLANSLGRCARPGSRSPKRRAWPTGCASSATRSPVAAKSFDPKPWRSKSWPR
jgi:hypothetical protein